MRTPRNIGHLEHGDQRTYSKTQQQGPLGTMDLGQMEPLEHKNQMNSDNKNPCHIWDLGNLAPWALVVHDRPVDSHHAQQSLM